MTSLKDLNIEAVYRSGSHDLLNDFYLPVLSTAKFYDRAVGYFSSSLIAYALKGITSIVRSDGYMRLIIGYPLDENEFEALQQGGNLKAVSSLLMAELNTILEVKTFKIEAERLKLFSLLVATNRLKIKFAFKKKGMYHEKIGVVTDNFGNKILFSGSANETTNAIHPDLNFESITVYKNWKADIYKEYAKTFEKGFESLWSNLDPLIFTIDMPSEMYVKLNEYHRENQILGDIIEINESELMADLLTKTENHYPVIPKKIKNNNFKIFEHQQIALTNWFQNQTTGLFKLATGAGKTITAMYGISKIFEAAESPRKMCVIIAVPYIALADQWCDELAIFNMKPIKCFSTNSNWQNQLSTGINSVLMGSIEFISIVVVNKTLCGEAFQNRIRRIPENNLFFVGDECHRHGTSRMYENLPKAKFKMGLSATPYIDDNDYLESNAEKIFLTKYYGEIVAEFSLTDALNKNILTPYNYLLFEIELTVEETDKYLNLTKEIGRLMSFDSSKENNSLSNAIRKRNKIIQNASNKALVLDQVLQKIKIKKKSHTIFYVGEGSSLDSEELIETKSQLQTLAEIIRKNGWRVSKFTSEESNIDRKRIMNSFVNTEIDALVSMKVLDEGIDIPQCENAFILASSANSRQFIQRRGRILRKYPGKTAANIYDFVVVPCKSINDTNLSGLVRRELKRVMDFVRPSLNRMECQRQAQLIGDQYGIELSEV